MAVAPLIQEPSTRAAAANAHWAAVASLIDRAGSLDDLRAHRLQLLAAAIWQASGRPVPAELRRDRRYAATLAIAAPSVLRRARAAYDGRLVLFKGPEVAAAYPYADARHFRDLDLFADDPYAAQHGLLAAGFVEEQFPGGWPPSRHLCPLMWPGIPLRIEIHVTPHLPPWLPAPSAEELMADCVPGRAGIAGVLAPNPSAHALLLTAHAWAHRPFGRVGDLVDIETILIGEDRSDVAALARRWGWDAMWRLTAQSTDALLAGAAPPLPLRLLGRNILQVRDLTVLEFHLQRVLAPLAAAPRAAAPTVLAGGLRELGAKCTEEGWRDKLGRSGAALRNARARKAVHDVSTNNHPWTR